MALPGNLDEACSCALDLTCRPMVYLYVLI